MYLTDRHFDTGNKCELHKSKTEMRTLFSGSMPYSPKCKNTQNQQQDDAKSVACQRQPTNSLSKTMMLIKKLLWILHLLRLGSSGGEILNATVGVRQNGAGILIADTCHEQVSRSVEEVPPPREEVPPPMGDNYPLNAIDYGEDMGVAQAIDYAYTVGIQQLLQHARNYMSDVVNKEAKYAPLRGECKNKHEHCAFWAVVGECQNNQGYMNVSCAPVCQTCEYLSLETRCPLDPDAKDAWYPGDLNKMFERIISQPEYARFEPKVASRPTYAKGDTPETADYHLGPWVVLLENMATQQEADRLIALGDKEGYQRSADVGALKFDGTFDNYINDGRTSENAWCQRACFSDPLAKAVIDRIENVTGIPETNSEFLQLLRYEVGQFYQTHNDLIPHQTKRQEGVRLLTVYIYLNEVEEGGGTNFPHLNITVSPKRGRAAIWPSVLNDNPNKIDWRTEHQALPVIKGVKYGANAWVHQRDFKTPNANGCS